MIDTSLYYDARSEKRQHKIVFKEIFESIWYPSLHYHVNLIQLYFPSYLKITTNLPKANIIMKNVAVGPAIKLKLTIRLHFSNFQHDITQLQKYRFFPVANCVTDSTDGPWHSWGVSSADQHATVAPFKIKIYISTHARTHTFMTLYSDSSLFVIMNTKYYSKTQHFYTWILQWKYTPP